MAIKFSFFFQTLLASTSQFKSEDTIIQLPGFLTCTKDFDGYLNNSPYIHVCFNIMSTVKRKENSKPKPYITLEMKQKFTEKQKAFGQNTYTVHQHQLLNTELKFINSLT